MRSSPDIPNCLYRVFDNKVYACNFIQHGRIWIFSAAKYRYLPDTLRRDNEEGSAEYSDIVQEIANCPVRVQESMGDQFYIFSTFGPDVSESHMKQFGKYIVRITSPYQLLEDFNKNRPQNIQHCVLKPINYGNGNPPIKRTPWISMTQKRERFKEDFEYRYIFQSTEMRNYGYEDWLDGGYDYRNPGNPYLMPAEKILHIKMDLGYKAPYLEKMW